MTSDKINVADVLKVEQPETLEIINDITDYKKKFAYIQRIEKYEGVRYSKNVSEKLKGGRETNVGRSLQRCEICECILRYGKVIRKGLMEINVLNVPRTGYRDNLQSHFFVNYNLEICEYCNNKYFKSKDERDKKLAEEQKELDKQFEKEFTDLVQKCDFCGQLISDKFVIETIKRPYSFIKRDKFGRKNKKTGFKYETLVFCSDHNKGSCRNKWREQNGTKNKR